MKQKCLLLLIVVATACGGSLSEEQRKKIQDEMRNSKISRVSESQITEAAFSRGRAIVNDLESNSSVQAKIDSVAQSQQVKIARRTGSTQGSAVEQAVFEAYFNSPVQTLEDNVQKIRDASGQETDSLLYSKPIVDDEAFKGMWSIWLSRKALVLTLTEKKR